jgi:dienelactone hydrolase
MKLPSTALALSLVCALAIGCGDDTSPAADGGADGAITEETGTPDAKVDDAKTGDAKTGDAKTGDAKTGDGQPDAQADAPKEAGPPAPTSGCGKPATEGQFTRNMTVSGTSREYVLKIPTGYDPKVAYPLFFSFHGSGSNGAGAIGGNDTIAGKPSIKVAPTNGDVPFVQAIVDALKAELCVDATRVYATGYSAGGGLADQVACQLGAQFRGVAVWEGFGSGSCATPVAMWINHNQDDTTVPYSMGVSMRDQWLVTDGCGTATAPFNAPDPCVIYTCTKRPVVWCAPATGGHKPPFSNYDSMINFFSGL